MKKTDLQGYRKNFIKFLSAFMVLFPWITYLRVERFSEQEPTVFFSYNGVRIDFFIYYKEIVLIMVAIVALCWFLGERFMPEKVDNNVPLLMKGQNKWLFILIGVFAIGSVLSTIFSKYTHTAFWGSPSVGEGLWTLLSYVVIIMMFYNSFANDFGMSMLKKVITILSGITIVLTMIEWFYKPILEIGLIQPLLAPSAYMNIISSMKASVFKSAISLTFYNPGYFGGFVCMLLPFVLMYFLQEKKLPEKILYGVLSAGLLFGIVAANTTTALYIAILEVLLVVAAYVLMTIRDSGFNIRLLIQGGTIFVLMVAVLLLSGVVTGNTFLNIFSNANSFTGTVVEERFEIEDIKLQNNKVVLTGEEAELVIACEDDEIRFYDDKGVQVSPAYKDDNYLFHEPEYKHIKVSVQSMPEKLENVQLSVLVDAGYKSTIDFYVLKTGEFTGIGQHGAVLTDIGDAGTPAFLKEYYGMFTGRGYAWVNSLPALKNTLLVGKGPGNFAYYFKQLDYVGLLDTHKSIKQIIDKPHNAYLQYAINVGVPAMLAFFGIFVGTLVKALRALWKKKKEIGNNLSFHLAAIISIIGFLIYSIINDSMVTVTPVMCMITGALLASCYMVDTKKQ